jgi:transposase-like protein
MRGVRFIVSDDHAGLKAARRAVLPGAIWQRCDVAPGFRTGRFFSYAASAMIMSTLACAGVRYPTLEWRRYRL